MEGGIDVVVAAATAVATIAVFMSVPTRG